MSRYPIDEQLEFEPRIYSMSYKKDSAVVIINFWPDISHCGDSINTLVKWTLKHYRR